MASHATRITLAYVLLVCAVPLTLLSAADDASIRQVDLVMYDDPKFDEQFYEIVVSKSPVPLWLKALERPDPELQRVTCDTLAIAKQRGMEGVEQSIPKIRELLEKEDLAPDARIAAVKALIAIGGEEYVEELVNQADRYGRSVASIVEPALIGWQSNQWSQRWLDRLDDPAESRQSLVFAIQGLGGTKTEAATDGLSRLLGNKSLATEIRVAAARSLGTIHSAGLTDLASQLISSPSNPLLDQILAAAILANHSDPDSVEILKTLADSEHSIVQSESLQTLYKIDPELVLGYVEKHIESPDVNVRRILAEALIWSRSPDSIAPLAPLLDDVNPSLRRFVAAELFRLAQSEDLRDKVISEVSGVLDSDDWRGCEQATLVLVSLDFKECGDRLVDLIDHPRAEVMVTAGWGLRLLDQKQHLPAMLGRAQRIFDGFGSGKYNEDSPGVVDLIAQLMMAFGQMGYEESEPLIRKYLPRDDALGLDSRAAACWAIGLLHPDDAPDDLVKLLSDRLNDVYGLIPEYEGVRQSCAVSLGRMNAQSSLPMLRKHAGDNVSAVNQACYWSIERITGETPPARGPAKQIDYQDWFLKPLDEPTETQASSSTGQ